MVSGTAAIRPIEPTSVATIGSATSWVLNASAVATLLYRSKSNRGSAAPTYASTSVWIVAERWSRPTTNAPL